MKNHRTITFLILISIIGCNKDSSIFSTLQNENRITAGYRYNDVNSLANPENKSNGLKLESIMSDDVDRKGTSEKWIYSYTSGGIAVTYFFHAAKDKIMQDSISTMIKLPPTQLISNKWMDSNDILQITEKTGGKDFRSNNADLKISLKLEEPLGYNSPTYWYVEYYSTKDTTKRLTFAINAANGELKI